MSSSDKSSTRSLQVPLIGSTLANEHGQGLLRREDANERGVSHRDAVGSVVGENGHLIATASVILAAPTIFGTQQHPRAIRTNQRQPQVGIIGVRNMNRHFDA